MIIETAYNITDTFWVPRVRAETVRHNFIDADGNNWYRDEEIYELSDIEETNWRK